MHQKPRRPKPSARRIASRLRRLLAVVAVPAVLLATHPAATAAAQSTGAGPKPLLAITSDHTNGIYEIGQTIRWRIEPLDALSTNGLRVTYTVRKGGLTPVREGQLYLTNSATEVAVASDEPGTFLLDVRPPKQDGKKTKFLAGAVVAPTAIQPSAKPPADFDPFWRAKLDELSKVPPNVQLTGVESDKAGVDYWGIVMDNIRGTHIRGQLARPRAGGKLPAMLILQGAGVYRLEKSWVTHRAANGWLALNINAHDLPIDREPAFYEAQATGPLKSYWKSGTENRERNYFLRMYLACYRAAQYLAERPDWDGKTLLAMGSSQGGLQTLVAAGLNPRVSAAIAEVPGGCDLTGAQVGRRAGWPAWYLQDRGTNSAGAVEAIRYYDVVNFVPRIKCPVLASAGLIDEICPAAGILAVMNTLQAPKEMVLLPQADHIGSNDSSRDYKTRSSAWVKALRDGRPVPPPR
jgi:cephalosporin-C deacetylase